MPGLCASWRLPRNQYALIPRDAISSLSSSWQSRPSPHGEWMISGRLVSRESCPIIQPCCRWKMYSTDCASALRLARSCIVLAPFLDLKSCDHLFPNIRNVVVHVGNVTKVNFEISARTYSKKQRSRWFGDSFKQNSQN